MCIRDSGNRRHLKSPDRRPLPRSHSALSKRVFHPRDVQRRATMPPVPAVPHDEHRGQHQHRREEREQNRVCGDEPELPERDRRRRHENPETEDGRRSRTGGALAGSAATTIFGFGILVTSTTVPFRQFGFVTAYTILLSLLAAVLVLPSMLVVWDRWHRRHGGTTLDVARVEHSFGES